jgi:predicted CoA-binding protein
VTNDILHKNSIAYQNHRIASLYHSSGDFYYAIYLFDPAAPCSYSLPVSAAPAVPFVIPLRLAFSAASWLAAVIDDALKKKDRIKVFWMQLGIYNEDAERKQRKMV